MKKGFIVSLLAVLFLPVLVMGCIEGADATLVPPLNGGPEAVTIEISTDEFTTQKHIVKDVELIVPGSLIVTLGSNPTTGFQWTELAQISNPIIAGTVIEQVSHNYVAPSNTNGIVGAPGKEVWVFDSLKPGKTTISLSYGQPWEGGAKDEWTLTLNITVK